MSLDITSCLYYHPRILLLIANVYAKQIAKDGSVIGTNTCEAFDKNPEKYV